MSVYRRYCAVAAFTALLFVTATFLLTPSLSGKDFGRICAWLLMIGIVAGAPDLKKRPPRVFGLAIVFGLVAIPAFVIERAFGTIDVLSLLAHMQFGIDGADLSGMRTEIREGIGGVVLFLISCFGLWALLRLPRVSIVIGGLALFLFNPVTVSLFTYAASAPVESGLQMRLVKPAVEQPTARPDVIIVYLEGIERTFNQTDRFGDIYSKVTEYEGQGLTLTNVHQVHGTGWSIAGLTATLCGLPLLPNGLRQKNKFTNQIEFMTSQTCLGDVTTAIGYENMFMVGGDASFGGIKHLMSSHSIDHLFDRSVLEGLFSADEVAASASSWVLDDQMLFEAALRIYDEKAQHTHPFLMIIETFGPHGKTGLLSRQCTPDGKSRVSNDVHATVKCTLRDTHRFIEHVRANRNDRPTLVVLLSDHLNFGSSKTAQMRDDERRNTAVMLSFGFETPYIRPGAVNDRDASMLDIYPTLLSIIGLAPANARGGLGVSLFSDDPTLVEEKGLDQLNRELYRNPDLARAIWD